ncbi:MAG TPA: hypothetical protein VMV44_00010 [Rectinemataceae bacterium]|nr:hypothetical protein [Rectinemataceae bacterium]
MAARPDIAPDSKSNRPAARRDDLERYGVWVKAEPQDIALEPESAESLEGSLEIPEDSFLTEEEERLLGSFDDADGGTARTEIRPELRAQDDIFSSLPEIEDFEPSMPSMAEETKGSSVESEAEDLEFELSMEDLSAGFTEPEIGPATHIDLSKVEGLDGESPVEDSFELPEIDLPEEVEEFETPHDSPQKAPRVAAAAGTELEDVSSEFLEEGFESSAETSSSVHDVTDEFMIDAAAGGTPAAAPPPSPAPRESPEPDFEPLDIELHFDDESGPAPVDHAAAGFEEVGELDGFLGKEEEVAEFDDLAALEQDLAGGGPSQPSRRTRVEGASMASSADSGLANELLLKIANELSSIRSELVTLKSQLATAKAEEPGASSGPEADESAEPETSGGFFDEEDDEKIALTGDELDNILSSADFTEEPSDEAFVAEAETGEEPIASSFEKGLLEEDLLPESGDYAPIEAVERISLDEEAFGEAPRAAEETAAGGDEVIARLAEEGIPPLTNAPEDTSYLEEPLEEEGLLDIPETPFVEAPLVEPDLTELTIDLVGDEDGLDISGELPVMESEELPDITLDLDVMESGETADMGEELSLEGEIVPEIEEDLGFEDIALAVEEDVGSAALVDEELVEELGGIPEGDFVFEEELHHEDKNAPLVSALSEEPFGTAHAEGEPSSSLELDEDLFVPSPSETEGALGSSRQLSQSGQEELSSELDIEPFEEEISFDEALEAESPLELAPEAPVFAPARPEVPSKPAMPAAEDASVPATKPDFAAPPSAVPAMGDPTEKLKSDIRSVLSYLDRLLESLPEEKIEEFAHSEHFDTYKKLFEELGLV